MHLLPQRGAPPARAAGTARTASGSVAVTGRRARVALRPRILVEGKHDAELVEKVWGDDLRVEGVVVEYLGGIDDLAGAVGDSTQPDAGSACWSTTWCPGPRSLGSTRRSSAGADAEHVLVVGHPFVDVWQAVPPSGWARSRGR